MLGQECVQIRLPWITRTSVGRQAGDPENRRMYHSSEILIARILIENLIQPRTFAYYGWERRPFARFTFSFVALEIRHVPLTRESGFTGTRSLRVNFQTTHRESCKLLHVVRACVKLQRNFVPFRRTNRERHVQRGILSELVLFVASTC